jgi:hypothetical protein
MDNISVAIRVRPLNDRETNGSQYYAWQIQDEAYLSLINADGKPVLGASPYVFGMYSRSISMDPLLSLTTCSDRQDIQPATNAAYI